MKGHYHCFYQKENKHHRKQFYIFTYFHKLDENPLSIYCKVNCHSSGSMLFLNQPEQNYRRMKRNIQNRVSFPYNSTSYMAKDIILGI